MKEPLKFLKLLNDLEGWFSQQTRMSRIALRIVLGALALLWFGFGIMTPTRCILEVRRLEAFGLIPGNLTFGTAAIYTPGPHRGPLLRISQTQLLTETPFRRDYNCKVKLAGSKPVYFEAQGQVSFRYMLISRGGRLVASDWIDIRSKEPVTMTEWFSSKDTFNPFQWFDFYKHQDEWAVFPTKN